MSTIDVPLINAIKEHQQKSNLSLHVPGHKNGLYFHESIHEDFKKVLPYDLTELENLDDLHAPEGAIKSAQHAASRLYGAKETFFLVGGTTVGNLAMVYALFNPGDVVFIQRNSHKSIFHAAQVAGITAILLAPEYDEQTNIPIGITAQTLERAFDLYPNAQGLLLTYPNYYGVSLDAQTLINEAKQRGLLVLVDEAHAAHYTLGKPFPSSTLSLGADVVVQSAHKMLPALTMSSFLHIGSTLSSVRIEAIKRSLEIFQSSSPSYLLMASLDGARAYLESIDSAKITQILAAIQAFKQELAKIEQINVIDWSDFGEEYHFDPLKVTIETRTHLSGFELEKIFGQVGLYPEMADEKNVLLVFGLGIFPTQAESIQRLKKVLSGYPVLEKKRNSFVDKRSNTISRLHAYPNQLINSSTQIIPIKNATGRISAETLIPYPPGVPILLIGEKITGDIIQRINQFINAGAKFQGYEGILKNVNVIDTEE